MKKKNHANAESNIKYILSCYKNGSQRNHRSGILQTFHQTTFIYACNACVQLCIPITQMVFLQEFFSKSSVKLTANIFTKCYLDSI